MPDLDADEALEAVFALDRLEDRTLPDGLHWQLIQSARTKLFGIIREAQNASD